MPHRKGSFHEDWNDLLARFAERRKHDRPRQALLEKALEEALPGEICPNFLLNEILFDRSRSN